MTDKRCPWAESSPLMREYHDREWGVPLHDDRALFELLILEGAQAGLSWATVLRKRPAYREAFEGFDPRRVGRYGEREVARLLSNPGIIRNRLKVLSAINNARRVLEVHREFGSFDAYLWQFVDGQPIKNRFRSPSLLPATSEISDRLSKELKRRGFTFVGSTICYALMQSIGMVNDHLVHCFRYQQM